MYCLKQDSSLKPLDFDRSISVHYKPFGQPCPCGDRHGHQRCHGDCLCTTGSAMKDSLLVCWQGCRKSSKKVPGADGFFDTARRAYGGSFGDSTVDGVISVVRLLPIFFFIIMYWAIYSQVRNVCCSWSGTSSEHWFTTPSLQPLPQFIMP